MEKYGLWLILLVETFTFCSATQIAVIPPIHFWAMAVSYGVEQDKMKFPREPMTTVFPWRVWMENVLCLCSSIFRFLLAINTQCAVIDMQIILNDILHDLWIHMTVSSGTKSVFFFRRDPSFYNGYSSKNWTLGRLKPVSSSPAWSVNFFTEKHLSTDPLVSPL